MPTPPLGDAVAAAAGWPLLDFMDACALPEAVAAFRARVRKVLGDWRLRDLIEPAELVVSELVTNSIAAIGSWRPVRRVWMWLISNGSRLLVVVADCCARPPAQELVCEAAECGRGLILVEAVSDRWGWYPCPASGQAKAVWAELAVPAGLRGCQPSSSSAAAAKSSV